MILKNGDDYNNIITFGTYHPYRRNSNSRFNPFSGKILDVKDKRNPGLDFFAQKLLKKLSNREFVVCTVPPSKKGPNNNGIAFLARTVIKLKDTLSDGTNCLRRFKTVPPSHLGGERSIEKHLSSIKVIHSEIVNDQHVFLLDDVTTTGSSMHACKQLLLDAGAKKVQCFALGKTES